MLSRWRRTLFVLIGTYVILEIFSFTILWILDGSTFTFSAYAAQRGAIATGSAEEGLVRDARTGEVPSWIRNKVLHPYTGYVFHPPEEALVGNAQEGLADYGFPNGTDPLRSRSDDHLIVAVLGGSVAMGFGLSPAASEVLEEELGRDPALAGKRIEIVDLAISGYHQPQQLMTLSYLLSLGAEFDVVVNLDGFNEIALHPFENARMGIFAPYPRAWYLYVRDLPQRDAGDYAYARMRRKESAKTFDMFPIRYSVTVNLIWRAVDRRQAAAVLEGHQAIVEASSRETSYVATGPRREYSDDEEMMRDLVSLWQRSSLQIGRLCRANGIVYRHFLQPSQYLPGTKTLSREEESKAFTPNHPARGSVLLGYPMLQEAGRELLDEGIHFVDLTGVFQEEVGTIYIDNLCHFNERGFELVAREVARAIRDRDEERKHE